MGEHAFPLTGFVCKEAHVTRPSKATNSAVGGPIRPKFKLYYHGNQRLDLAEFQTHPSSHVCYNYLQVWKRSDQEKPRKSGDIVFPIISHWGFFRRSRAANSAVSGPIRPKFELIRALMHVIIACKYEKDRMKNSREKVKTPFSPL